MQTNSWLMLNGNVQLNKRPMSEGKFQSCWIILMKENVREDVLTWGQLNLSSGHDTTVQLLSSVPSVQSWRKQHLLFLGDGHWSSTLYPSHLHLAGMQRLFSHRNWPLWHGGKSEKMEEITIIIFSSAPFLHIFLFGAFLICFGGATKLVRQGFFVLCKECVSIMLFIG